jgi:hypothetical protein
MIALGVKPVRKPSCFGVAQSTSFPLNLVGVAPNLASVAASGAASGATLAEAMLNVIVTKVLRHKGSMLAG